MFNRTSISHAKHSIPNFYETEQYLKIKSHAEEERTLILHCHGFPGSGKSQLVLKLAENFPFEQPSGESNLYIKWYIQCCGRENEIKHELTELLLRMRQHMFIHSSSVPIDDMKKNIACSFLATVCNSGVPILIIIDDVDKKDPFLDEFLRCVDAHCGNKEKNIKFHIYLTTRQKSNVLSEEEGLAMKNYQKENIVGFNKSNGIKFLLGLNSKPENEDESACAAIFHRFSGSPLGLRVAKAYCTDAGISYEQYVEQSQTYDKEIDLQNEELEVLKAEYGENAQHIFQTITMPFKICPVSSEEAKRQWKVLSCLSYFHHDQIPNCVVKKCFQIVRGDMTDENKFDFSRLRRKLTNCEMCVSHNNDLYFHEVVLHAFRICQRDPFVERKKHLINAIWTMAGLLTKDVGTVKNLTKMHKLFRHVESLLIHVEKGPLTLSQTRQAFLVSTVISRLYEAAGAVALTLPSYVNKSLDYFRNAKEIIWHKDAKHSLCEPEEEVSVDDVASYIVEQCELSGSRLPDGFITEYVVKVFRPDSICLKFLEKQCGDRDSFKKLKEVVEAKRNNSEIIETLRKCEVFLHEDTQRKVFFAERLASIFHSWSRAIIYKEVEKTDLTVEKCLWLSSLAHAISQKCRKFYKVELLFEHLSYITRKTYIAIERKNDSQALQEAKQVCEELIAQDPSAEGRSSERAFCNGLLVEIHGLSHPSKKNQILRYMVRVYGRLLKNGQTASQYLEDIASQGDSLASELLSFATEQFHDVSNAPTSVIQCGKYFAARENFDKAFECFNMYFDNLKCGNTMYQFHSWSVYNYARAVLYGNHLDKLNRASKYVEDVLEDIESPTHAITIKKKLEEIKHLISKKTSAWENCPNCCGNIVPTINSSNDGTKGFR